MKANNSLKKKRLWILTENLQKKKCEWLFKGFTIISQWRKENYIKNEILPQHCQNVYIRKWNDSVGCTGSGERKHCGREHRTVQPLWRSVWRFNKKWEARLAWDPMIPLLGTFPKDSTLYYRVSPACDVTIPLLGTFPKDSTFYYRVACSSMFIAALVIRARKWNQTRCPLTNSG